MAELPSHPEAITPLWLTERLNAAGVIGDAAITGISWQPIGAGHVGESARFTLTYDREGPWPATIAGKFPATDPTSRATAAAFGVYTKEVNFYREIASRLQVRAPAAYVAEIAPNGVDFILLMEDLAPARSGDQIAGCNAADARAAIRQAAAIHAPSWNNQELLATAWLRPQPETLALRAAFYAKAHAEFRERYASALEPEFLAVCDELNEVIEHSIAHDARARSIVHGDFRLDNMLFDIRGGAEAVAVLDWQTVAIGNGLTDVAYFLGTGIGDSLRRAHETELLDLYCTEMTRLGAPLTRDEIWDDYVIGGLRGVANAVISAAHVKRTARGDACFLSMARGGCALAHQHGSISKLKG